MHAFARPKALSLDVGSAWRRRRRQPTQYRRAPRLPTLKKVAPSQAVYKPFFVPIETEHRAFSGLSLNGVIPVKSH